MIKVQLETRAGAFVAEVEIPLVVRRPDVLVWRGRFFRCLVPSSGGEHWRECTGYYYHEADQEHAWSEIKAHVEEGQPLADEEIAAAAKELEKGDPQMNPIDARILAYFRSYVPEETVATITDPLGALLDSHARQRGIIGLGMSHAGTRERLEAAAVEAAVAAVGDKTLPELMQIAGAGDREKGTP